ncbi:MAG: transglycosylase SLT domain-containing protein [Elusimicrobia bacterium]|nr:transglycosylase SLT domain-containing protein [Elusimicrobiota bacterium]
MRHPGLREAVLAAALFSLAIPLAAETGAGQRSHGVVPTKAQLTERRNALLESLEGWRGLSQAEGAGLAEIAGRLENVKASLLHLPVDADLRSPEALRALETGIDTHRTMFEDWKKEFLAALYAAKNHGQELASAAPEARERFAAFTDRQADVFRELAHRPAISAGRLDSLRAQIAGAQEPSALDRIFDNEALRAGLPAMALASARTDIPQQAVYERPVHATPASFSPAPSHTLAVQPLAHGLSNFRVDGAVVPSPAASHPVTADDGGALKGASAKGDKRSWQVELLKRTGAWSILSSVGVDPETFIRSLTGAESGYATDATSSAGAAGVMQVMPETARGIMKGSAYKRIAREYGLAVYDQAKMSSDAIQRMLNRDWRTNILLGMLYIKDQADTFVGYAERARVSIEDKAKLMMNMVAGAYNAGPGRVWQALNRLRSQGVSLASINPAQSLVKIRETQNYVKKILRDYGSRLFAENASAQPDRARG